MTDFTIGQNCQVTVTGPYGKLPIPLGTKFVVNQTQSNPTIKTLSGSRIAQPVFDGWSGSFEFAQIDATLDNLAQQYQQATLAGVPIPKGSITYQVRTGGSLLRWQLVAVTYTFPTMGTFSADTAVMQTLNWMAEQRQAA